MAETPLQEQVAIITGAGHGIGRAIAQRLAFLGAQVVLVARKTEALDALAAEIAAAGGRAWPHACDLRRPDAVEAMVTATLRMHLRVDILVNNAGVGAFSEPLHRTSLTTWQAIMETNLQAPYLAMRAVAPHMMHRGSGHIINISSLAAHNPVPNAAAYAASKWGLNGLSVSAAEELRGHGVRVSLICPGSVDTALLTGTMVEGRKRSAMLRPEDVAHAVEAIVTQRGGSFMSEILLRPVTKP